MFKYGSILIAVTRSPHAFKIVPILLDITPIHKIKKAFLIYGMEVFTRQWFYNVYHPEQEIGAEVFIS